MFAEISGIARLPREALFDGTRRKMRLVKCDKMSFMDLGLWNENVSRKSIAMWQAAYAW
jgi:hypothetical protein